MMTLAFTTTLLSFSVLTWTTPAWIDPPKEEPPAPAKADPETSKEQGPATGPGGIVYENKPENLKAVFVKLREAHLAKDEKTVAGFVRDITAPTSGRILKALRPDVPKERLEQIDRFYAKYAPKGDDKSVARFFRPEAEMSEVLVITHKASELARGVPTLPGGYGRIAREILNPEAVIHRVLLVKPGETKGYAIDMVWWDGKKWCVLGALWRASYETDKAPEPDAPASPSK